MVFSNHRLLVGASTYRNELFELTEYEEAAVDCPRWTSGGGGITVVSLENDTRLDDSLAW